MTDIKNAIEPTDVEWTMDWSGTKEDGTRRHPDKPETETVFEKEAALAHLLINDVIFLNDHWWEEDWPAEARATVHLGVNCNDVFAWGCADAEGAGHRDIEPLYRMWAKDPVWGAAVWCMVKRREMPQRPIEKRLRDGGVWDLDALAAEHGLRPNHYDGISGVQATYKYERYCVWERDNGREPRPYDAKWWDGWREYVTANPGWHDRAWQAEEGRRAAEWRMANGHGTEIDALGPIEGVAWAEILHAIAEGREPDVGPESGIVLPEDLAGLCRHALDSVDPVIRIAAAEAFHKVDPKRADALLRRLMEGEENRFVLATYRSLVSDSA